MLGQETTAARPTRPPGEIQLRLGGGQPYLRPEEPTAPPNAGAEPTRDEFLRDGTRPLPRALRSRAGSEPTAPSPAGAAGAGAAKWSRPRDSSATSACPLTVPSHADCEPTARSPAGGRGHPRANLHGASRPVQRRGGRKPTCMCPERRRRHHMLRRQHLGPDRRAVGGVRKWSLQAGGTRVRFELTGALPAGVSTKMTEPMQTDVPSGHFSAVSVGGLLHVRAEDGWRHRLLGRPATTARVTHPWASSPPCPQDQHMHAP